MARAEASGRELKVALYISHAGIFKPADAPLRQRLTWGLEEGTHTLRHPGVVATKEPRMRCWRHTWEGQGLPVDELSIHHHKGLVLESMLSFIAPTHTAAAAAVPNYLSVGRVLAEGHEGDHGMLAGLKAQFGRRLESLCHLTCNTTGTGMQWNSGKNRQMHLSEHLRQREVAQIPHSIL